MKDIYINGYINYENNGYTFSYENKKLTLINIKSEQTFFSTYKHIELFQGFTLDGFDIVFYINNNIYYKDGRFVCSPRCIIISWNKEYKLDEMQFSTLRISGGILNRFYSNRNMIEFDPSEKEYFKIKNIEKTVSEEIVNLNGEDFKFELSIMKPGWKDDGIITFNNYDTLLRIKYSHSKNYKSILENLNIVDDFFKFCANRADICFDNIFLEIKNNDGKYDKAAKIIVPYMIDNEIKDDMLDYILLKGHLSEAFKFLKNSDYIFSIIPDDNKSFGIVSNKDYCAAFSCFESIYQYVYGNNEIEKQTKEEAALNEVKKEILPFLKKIEQDYKGKNKNKRDFINRFINIISNSNLKLEKCITNELEKNDFIIESIYYKRRNYIKENGVAKSVIEAVEDRDNITHNNVVKLNDKSIGIYEMIIKLNYAMILEYIGISKDNYEEKITNLGLLNII